MYYSGSENNDADQLRCREADPRICFRICKKSVFSQRGSILYISIKRFIFKQLGPPMSASEVLNYINDRFSHKIKLGSTYVHEGKFQNSFAEGLGSVTIK